MSVGKLRIAMLSCLGIGFLGCIVSGVITATIFIEEQPSVFAVSIIVFFAIILVSSPFLLIPYNKIIKTENNKIITEYGSGENKAKTYSIYHNIVTVDANNKQKIVRQLFFSSLGVKSNTDINLFYWKDVKRVRIERDIIVINSLSKNQQQSNFIFPNKQYFNLLIKTFCDSEMILEH